MGPAGLEPSAAAQRDASPWSSARSKAPRLEGGADGFLPPVSWLSTSRNLRCLLPLRWLLSILPPFFLSLPLPLAVWGSPSLSPTACGSLGWGLHHPGIDRMSRAGVEQGSGWGCASQFWKLAREIRCAPENDPAGADGDPPWRARPRSCSTQSWVTSVALPFASHQPLVCWPCSFWVAEPGWGGLCGSGVPSQSGEDPGEIKAPRALGPVWVGLWEHPAPKDRCHIPASRVRSLPGRWGAATLLAGERKQAHLPAGMQKGGVLEWGGVLGVDGQQCPGALGPVCALCCLPLAPTSGPVAWPRPPAAVVRKPRTSLGSTSLGSELTPQLCPWHNGALSAQYGHQEPRHGLVT